MAEEILFAGFLLAGSFNFIDDVVWYVGDMIVFTFDDTSSSKSNVDVISVFKSVCELLLTNLLSKF